MTDYLLEHGGKTIYFFHTIRGELCSRENGGRVQLLYPTCKDFSVLQKTDGEVEILCLGKENELVYLLPDSHQSHVITKISTDIEVLKLRFFEFEGRAYFIYSARYREELFMICSLLGNNALPKTLAKLKSPDFFIHQASVFFTAQEDILGYINFASMDFRIFNGITKGAISPCLISADGRDMITYTKDGKVFFQNRVVSSEPDAENPVLFFEQGLLFLMWKSKGFIRYKKSADFGRTWSGEIQFISPGLEARLCVVLSQGEAFLRYIEGTGGEFHLLGEAVGHEKSSPTYPSPAKPDELSELRAAVKNQARELGILQRDISKIKKVLGLG